MPETPEPEELFAAARLRDYKARRSSSWDRTGGNGDAVPVLILVDAFLKHLEVSLFAHRLRIRGGCHASIIPKDESTLPDQTSRNLTR